MRPLGLSLLTAAALAAAPALAAAAPPPNDNYLASTTITQSPFTDTVDTSEATTQPDLFNPNAQGQPLGGYVAENTTCNGVGFGKTVWYDLQPDRPGGVEIDTSGFDDVVTVYQWGADSKIIRQVTCQRMSTAETPGQLLLSVDKGKAYTFQVGGVNGAGGPLSFHLEFFPDTDGDGILDAQPDKCPTVPGISRYGGCPPSLRGKVSPSLSFANAGSGIRITRLVVDGVPKGAKVSATGGGASQTVKASKAGRVTLSRLVGRTASAGGKVTLRVTMAPTGSGTYKYGATGALYQWPVKAGGLGGRVQKCLKVGSASAIVKCP
jgi:hypothetical protein